MLFNHKWPRLSLLTRLSTYLSDKEHVRGQGLFRPLNIIIARLIFKNVEIRQRVGRCLGIDSGLNFTDFFDESAQIYQSEEILGYLLMRAVSVSACLRS